MVNGQPSVLVSGHYGAGNIGDEFISLALARLAGGRIKADLVLLSHSTLATERICRRRAIAHPAFGPNGLRNLRTMFEEVQRADVVWVGGGGIFQDEFNLRTVPKYCLPAIAAAWVGKPYVLYSVGVGPLSSGYGRRLTQLVASGAAKVTVRDEASRKLLAELGITDAAIVPDPAKYLLATEGSHSEWVTNLIEEELAEEFILLSLRAIWHKPSIDRPRLTWLSDSTIDELIAELKSAFAEIGCKVVIVPAYRDHDSEINKRMADAMGDQGILVDKDLDPDDWLQLLGAASLVISMPLHPALIACANGTPALTIAYGPKVRQQMEIWGLDQYVVGFGEFAKIPEHLHRLWRMRHEESARLRRMSVATSRDVEATFKSNITATARVRPRRRLAIKLALLTAFGWIPEMRRRPRPGARRGSA